MSILLTSALVAGGFLVGRWIMKSTSPKRRGEESADAAKANAEAVDDAAKDGDVAKDETPVKKPPDGDPFDSFPAHLGDVVMRTGGDVAWLAGALLFSEEVPIAALFVAPDAGGDRALFVRPIPTATIVWLDPIGPGELITGSEPPTSLEHKSTRFDRVRRHPVHVSRVGTGAPDIGERAILAEYEAPGGERIVVVIGAQMRAWRGTALEPGMYDVLPSGRSTLE